MSMENDGASARRPFAGLRKPGVLSYQRQQRRQSFRKKVAEALREYGIDVVSVELARGASDEPIWKLTIISSQLGSLLLMLPFNKGTDPYSEQTLTELLGRVASRVQQMIDEQRAW